MDAQAFIQDRQARINLFLQSQLPPRDCKPTHLHEAMHYVVLNGGKRIRPLLVYATGESLGLKTALLDLPASAIEFIHAYSLVHDDLPAMDDDDFRRGKPTCHKAYDEGTAILVGDALQTLAFHLLSERHQDHDSDSRIAMINCLSVASGSRGMAGGQALDLKATGQQLLPENLEEIHHLKTGALIVAAVKLGILAAKVADDEVISSLVRFAIDIGLCFQIKDDILNLCGSTEQLGKSVGTDLAKQKATYVTQGSLEQAKEQLDCHYQQAIRSLAPLGQQGKILQELADYIVNRNQ